MKIIRSIENIFSLMLVHLPSCNDYPKEYVHTGKLKGKFVTSSKKEKALSPPADVQLQNE